MSDATRSTDDAWLSVVIPAFDEVGRIGETARHVCAYLSAQSYAWEVLIVLDGGRPGAPEEIAEALGGRSHVSILDNHVNRGKGWSVRRGMLAARGRYRVFIDADLSLPIDGMPTLIDALERGADVAIGSRALPASQITGHLAGFRTSMGHAFNLIVRFITRCSLRDTQCGFKGFRAEAAHRIFRVQRLDRFGFDVEVLWLARRFGYRIVEVPVTCHYHGASSVRRAWDALSMLLDLLRIRWYDRTGRYDR